VDWLTDGELASEVQRLHRMIARVQARLAQVVAAATAEGSRRRRVSVLPPPGSSPSPGSRLRCVAAGCGSPSPCSTWTPPPSLPSRRPVRMPGAAAGRRLGRQPEPVPRDEALLIHQARTLSAHVFPKALSYWRRLADPDGGRADAEAAFLHRRLTCRPAGRAESTSTATSTPNPDRSCSPPSAPWPSPPAWTPATGAPPNSAAPTPWWRSAPAPRLGGPAPPGRRTPPPGHHSHPRGPLRRRPGRPRERAHLCRSPPPPRLRRQPHPGPSRRRRPPGRRRPPYPRGPPILRRALNCATGAAPTPAATSPPGGATPTTASTGPRAAPPSSPISGSCAGGTTGRSTRAGTTRSGSRRS